MMSGSGGQVRRSACTQCGRCCNRSPEVELSEAAALADTFVFRLMFRLYGLPATPQNLPEAGAERVAASEAFYQQKRLLEIFAARKRSVRVKQKGLVVERVQYFVISALTLATRSDRCAALHANCCGVHERRPLACRSVPFHYSRAEASAASDLEAFVATPGYACATGEEAAPVLAEGRIIDPVMLRARADAQALAERDRSWKAVILRRMQVGQHVDLPSLTDIEANAPFGALTTWMRVAWEIAGEIGLLRADEVGELLAIQIRVIDRELASPECPRDARETLVAMKAEYREPGPAGLDGFDGGKVGRAPA